MSLAGRIRTHLELARIVLGRFPAHDPMTEAQARAISCFLRRTLNRINRHRRSTGLEPLVLHEREPTPTDPLVREEHATEQLEQDLERLNAMRTAAGRRPLELAIVSDEPEPAHRMIRIEAEDYDHGGDPDAPESAPTTGLPTIRITGGAHGTDSRLYLNGRPFDSVRSVTLRVDAETYTTAEMEVLAEAVETTTQGVIIATLEDGTRYLLRDAVELPSGGPPDPAVVKRYAAMLESERPPSSTPGPGAPIPDEADPTIAPNVERTLHTLVVNVQQAAQFHLSLGDLNRIGHAIRTAYRLGHQDGRKEPALRYHIVK